MRMTLVKAITTVLISITLLGLGGCASGIVDPVKGSPTVADSYQAAMRGQTSFYQGQQSDYRCSEYRSGDKVRRLELPMSSRHSAKRKNSGTELESTLSAQFPKVPNPKSVMYVFGHYAGNGQIPVAGHFVPFSLYTRNYYAMPNEVLSPYNDGQFNKAKGSA